MATRDRPVFDASITTDDTVAALEHLLGGEF
jgi:hypothetical protein